MKRLLFCLVLSCAAPPFLFSQAFQWAQHLVGSTYEDGLSIATDSAGNVYTTGYFQDSLDVGGGILLQATLGTADIFIQKADPQGNVLWAKQIGGDGVDVPSALTVDPSGNLLLTGRFSTTVDFDPGPATANFTATGGYDAFVLKLNPDGDFVWARQLAGSFVSLGNKIAVGASGSVYVAGDFNGIVDFDPGAGENLLEAMGNWLGFILKLDAAGHFSWAKQVGVDYAVSLQGLALDRQGGLITTGWFKTYVDGDPGPGTAGVFAVEGYDIFVQKLDTAGNFLWVKGMGGTGYDLSFGLETDGSGNILVAGNFEKTVDFDPGPGVFTLAGEGSGSTDIFIEKLSPNGDFLWAKRIGSEYTDELFALDLDDAGNIYATGKYSGPVDFDPGPNVFTVPPSGVFILKLDFSGDFGWATHIQTNGRGNAIAVDRKGSVYVTGNFQVFATMNPGDSTTLVFASGPQDVFILKLLQEWDFHGTVFHDLNQNGLQDAGESGLRGVIMRAQNQGKYATTNALGQYHFYDNILGDTVRTNIHWNNWTTTPLFALPDSAQTALNFAATGPAARDVCLAMVELTPFRPGFQTEIVLQITNVGTVPIDTVPVKLLLLAPGSPLSLQFLSAVPAPMAQSSEEISWVTGPLAVGQMVEIRVFFRMPVTAPNGTPVVLSATAFLADDAFASNNGSRIQTTTVGSYDPNDKTVTPSVGAPQVLDTTDLRYVIRFQNTGTYAADFVVIRDTLSAALDLSTLRVLAASHPYTWRLSGPRILEFRFDQINLPDSTANEPDSHGFVAFTVRAQPGLSLGDSISNRAGIYFDYNTPVITNSAVLKAAIVSKVTEPAAWIDFGLSPNPVASFSQVAVSLPEASSEATTVLVSDVEGRIVQKISMPKGERRVYLQGMPAGSYFVQIRTGKLAGGKVLIVE